MAFLLIDFPSRHPQDGLESIVWWVAPIVQLANVTIFHKLSSYYVYCGGPIYRVYVVHKFCSNVVSLSLTYYGID